MTLKNINCLPLPKWVYDLLVMFGGLRKLEVVDMDNVGAGNVDSLVVFEDDYLKHRESLLNALKSKILNTLVIFNTHSFLFNDQVLAEIDRHSADLDIHIICQGHFAKKYNNVKVHHIELEEHFISHHFNLLLATKLQEMKNIEKTFLVQMVNKDEFRNTVISGITSSNLMNDIVLTVKKGPGVTKNLMDMHKSLMDYVKEEYKENPQIFPALDSFGGVCPNFSLYEKPFCEVVAETKNTGAYHLTEKTFRPIAFRVPIIFLGSKVMYDSLNEYGYTFYDNQFYKCWHDENISLVERVNKLVSVMQHIKEDETAKEQMQLSANSNFQVFWNQRKLYYYQNWNQIFDQICKGKDISRVVDSIYSRCNF